jgi:hypothetical protein
MANSKIPNLPPLSTTTKFRSRRSKNPLYPNSSPEWCWKISPILPELWIRDARMVTPGSMAELEEAWLYYLSLNIPGKGDGASLKCLTRSGRKKLEEEYKMLDDRTRRAKEVALARCEAGFTIRGTDGSLDYCTEGKKDVKKRARTF